MAKSDWESSNGNATIARVVGQRERFAKQTAQQQAEPPPEASGAGSVAGVAKKIVWWPLWQENGVRLVQRAVSVWPPKIEESHLTPGDSRSRSLLVEVRGIVVHWVGRPSSAVGVYHHFNSVLTDTSAHYVIGQEGEILQLIPEEEQAHHAYPTETNETFTPIAERKLIDRQLEIYPNNCTIGIELCHPEDDGKFTDATFASAFWLIQHLLDKYKLADERVYRHYDITMKRCPEYLVDEVRWARFKEVLLRLRQYRKAVPWVL